MDNSTYQIMSLIIPGLVAIIGNIIFYCFIKNRVDKSIERFKISYSGIYKEKINIYKEVLKDMCQLKLKIQQYQFSGNTKLGEELRDDFNQFISLYKVNSPFLTEEILKGLNKIREEYQSCFDSFYLYHSNLLNKETDPKVTIELSKKSIQSLNKLRNNDPFKQIEELLIAEMKKDLRIFE
ncbi:hypothetical protein [Macellibacteroides fermentans]|uniref:hypothetical protein n=1 Tax=Macellibacteroides fermentans TaxID=879969 RepID=UPI00406C6785